jgi:hypothetical protein
MSEWKPIETAPDDVAFLVTDGAYIAEVFPRSKSGSFRVTADGYAFGNATHWMPCPELPPTDETEGGK